MLEQVLGLSRVQTQIVVQIMFSYLFCEINKSELKRRIGNQDVYTVVSKQLLHNGYLLKNCKAYLYARHVCRLKGVRVSTKEFGVLKEDVPYLNKVRLTLKSGACKPLSLSSIDWLVSHIYSKPFEQYIGKYISKKMSFLLHSYGVDRLELQSELQLAGIYAIYKKYPYFKSKLHALNTAKTAIHNRGINLILFYTRKRRQRLVRDADGFFSQINTNIEDMQVPCIDLGKEKRELSTAFSQLQQKTGKRGSLFLKLALGEYDEGFSSYLNKNNDELIDSCRYGAYMNKVCRYLGVSKEQVSVFLQKLKPYL